MADGISFQAIAMMATMGVFGITFIGFWWGLTDRIAKIGKEAETKIESIERDADKKIITLRAEREKAGADFGAQIAALQFQVAAFREQVARESSSYITREMLREFETRMERQAKDSADRSLAAIADLATRLDRIIEGRATTRTKR